LAGQLLIWVLNRNRVTYWGNVVTQLPMAGIAVALPNSITRSVRRASGFVQVPFEEVCGGAALAGWGARRVLNKLSVTFYRTSLPTRYINFLTLKVRVRYCMMEAIVLVP
jgi:hypothetical protein